MVDIVADAAELVGPLTFPVAEGKVAALVARGLAAFAKFNQARHAASKSVLDFGLALHLGDVFYGNIGANDRLDFTVVGPAVNEVSRIEFMCRALDQDLVISADFAKAAKTRNGRLASLGRYVLRGVRRPQELFTLVAEEDL